MSREIKFRAWDKVNKIMTYNSINAINFDGQILLNDGKFHDINKTDYILMQYTGIKDKNGKEIFEGDVLKIYYEGNQRSYLKKVKWLNDAINKGRWDALDNCVFTSCEIVGNIYENKELITEVKNG